MPAQNARQGSFGIGPWKWPAMVALLAAFFSLGRVTGAAQKRDDPVRLKNVATERFELRGADGKTAAVFEGGDKGGTTLTFFDKDHHPRLTIGLDAKGAPSIFFLGEDHKPRLTIATDAEGNEPAIHLCDDQGAPAISLSLVKGFGPGLSIGKVGGARASIGIGPNGSASIQLWDKRNRGRVTLSVVNEGPMLLFNDEQGGIRGAWRLLADGTPILSIHDSDAKPRLVVRTDPQGKPLIQFIDADNKVTREIK